MVCGGLWWFAVVCGGLWWIAVVCLLVIPVEVGLVDSRVDKSDSSYSPRKSFGCVNSLTSFIVINLL